ncbi:hypothetical protein SEA_LILBEANIE_73 [Gordonia phage Lilbeanie]|uniref:Uncharacterized protein n=1 Tax=Gordonia phage Lilbeanie TaxID=2794947 RepID=A0A7T1NWA9_9CAUD|nr:hypothetical protein J1773_gp73 [Gordonia phage Lilbeanie]QPO17151.1 hypothetical protein SEA_LILBEANIE_73 [Gordonia phage Lilbeanie]
MAFADERSERVFTAVANAVEQAGGKTIEQLPDGRYICVIVAHDRENL